MTTPSTEQTPALAVEREPPGFRAGFFGVVGALAWLVGRPRAWPYALVPVAVFSILGGLAVAIAIAWVEPWVLGFFADAESSLGRFGANVAAWLGAALVGVVGLALSALMTPPLSAPALERIVAMQESELSLAPRAPMSLLAEFWCGLRAQAMAAAVCVPALAALWLVELLFPVATPVTLPLKLLITALSVAWNLLDYPLTLRGIGVRARLGLLTSHPGAIFGFGAAFALLFWLPCCTILLLPAGVAAATRLVWQILDADRTLLPELPRAPRKDAREERS